MSKSEYRRLSHQMQGKTVRFRHQPKGQTYKVISREDDMIEIDGLPGLFAPELFIVLSEGRCRTKGCGNKTLPGESLCGRHR